MSAAVVHIILIICSITSAFLVSKTPLANYDVFIGAFLFIALFVVKKLLQHKEHERVAESVIFTFIITLIINTTGGLASPFFFLFYFLLFSLSLLLDPLIPIVVTITLVAFFFVFHRSEQGFAAFLPLLSLVFITPFALFLGEEFVKERKEKEKNKVLASEMNQEKENTFLFLSLVLKNHIKTIKDTVDNFTGDHHLDVIKTQAHRMEKVIDEFEQGM